MALSDDFNRADTARDFGPLWDWCSADGWPYAAISSNEARDTGQANNVGYVRNDFTPVDPTKVFSQVDYYTTLVETVTCAVSHPGGNVWQAAGYMLWNQPWHNDIMLTRNGTQVASFAVPSLGGAAHWTRLRLERRGAVLTVLVDGLIVGNYTDPTPLTGTKIGFGFGQGSGVCRQDNWIGGDLLSSVTYPFTQANGPAVGWTQLGPEQLQVVGNRAQVISANTSHMSYIFATDTNLSGDIQVDFDCWAPLISGDGYVSVAVLTPSGDGYSVVAGNAVHIYPYTGGTPGSYLVNSGRTQNQNHVTFTRVGATGRMDVYLDGVAWANITDTSKQTGILIFVDMMAKNFPSEVTWMDNLTLSNVITGYTPPTGTTPSRNLESTSARYFESAADRNLESGPISGGGSPPLWKGVGVVADGHVAADMVTLNVSWFYDWASYSVSVHEEAGPGVEYVPMMWGDWINDPRWGSATGDGSLGGDPASSIGSAHTLLGFNEPDQGDQSDVSVDRALTLWPQLEATGARLGSPAVTAGTGPLSGWLADFMSGHGHGYIPRVDFMCVHWYPVFSDVPLADYLDLVHATYPTKPIWLTEVSDLMGGVSASAALVPSVMATLSTRPWVERVAWYTARSNTGWPGSALINTDGTLNAAGTAYAPYPPGGPVQLTFAGTSGGTSTTAAALGVNRGLVGSSAGTSTASSPLSVTRGLIAVASAGTSTASSPLVVDRSLVAVASAGTSTAAGPLVITKGLGGSSAGVAGSTAAEFIAISLIGSSAGTSATSGTMAGSSVQQLAGNSAGTSTAGATTLAVAAGLVGSSAGTSTATSPVGVNRSLIGSSAGTSTASATMAVALAVHLVGSSDGTSTAASPLAVALTLVGSSAGTSTASGTLQTISGNVFNGASNGSSTTTAALAVVHTLVSSAAGTSTASGPLAKTVGLIGSSAGSSTASSTIAVDRGMVTSSPGTSTATSTGFPVARALVGSSAGVGAIAPALMTVNTSGGLSGVIAGTSLATGTLTTAVGLKGSSVGTSTANADLVRTYALSGSSAGTSTATVTGLIRAVPMSGSSGGSSTASGSLRDTVAMIGAAAGLSTAAAITLAMARRLNGSSNGLSTANGNLQAIVILQIYGMWNGQVFDAMQYGDKPVVAFQITTT